MKLEKDRPPFVVDDALKDRRITYYFSDVPPHPFRASTDLKSDDGESMVADKVIDDKVMTPKDLEDLHKLNDTVWKLLTGSQGLAVKP